MTSNKKLANVWVYKRSQVIRKAVRILKIYKEGVREREKFKKLKVAKIKKRVQGHFSFYQKSGNFLGRMEQNFPVDCTRVENGTFNNTRTLKFKGRATEKRVFRYRQSNEQLLLPVSDYCQSRGNQNVGHSSDNETVLGSSRKLGGPAEHLIDGSEKNICRWSAEF